MLTAVQEMGLIVRCVTLDDRDAFGQLVAAYNEPLRRFLLNLTLGDAALTDDLSQETFLKAWLAIRSFKGVARFKTWLFRIAYNEFVSWKRRELPSEDIEISSLSRPPSVSLQWLDAKMDVASAMETLTDKERTVTLLFYLEELPIKKIVKITGFPEGTVKVYLSRARYKMAEIMNELK
ncbi:MAG: RNA polymerase sigma factor [Muribaculaceae bacterium]|nr:RNA polymerase sigma factor [Muribaculaceae bacterium]